VYQINQRKSITKELQPYHMAILQYQTRIKFNLSWVPIEENIALSQDLKSFPKNKEIEINFESEGLPKIKELRSIHIGLI